MAVVGLKMVTLALVNYNFGVRKVITGTEGLSEDGILQIDDTFLGSKTANITGLSKDVAKTYTNNSIKVYPQIHAEPQVTLEINNLSFEILSKLLGKLSDESGGYYQSFNLNKIAMLIELPTLDYRNSLYFGFGSGLFVQPTVAAETNTGNPNVIDDALTYTAESVPDFENNLPYKTFYSGDPNFNEAKMMSAVFPT